MLLPHGSLFFQFSVRLKKDSAHEDSIWTCVWGRRPDTTEQEEVEVEVEHLDLEEEDKEQEKRPLKKR